MMNFPAAALSKQKQVKLILIVYFMKRICVEVPKTAPRFHGWQGVLGVWSYSQLNLLQQTDT